MSGLRSRFVSRYLDPLAVDAEVDAIVAAFPDLCRLQTLPHRTHGYFGSHLAARGRHPMHLLRITAPGGPPAKPAVLFMRSHHAREWINALAIVETARQLVENYRPDDPDPAVRTVVRMLDRVELLIVPESNPDGARLSFYDEGRKLWRKNLRPAPPPACPRVDCNRNFSRYFGAAGSSANQCADVYHGPTALSEPETANIAHIAATERSLLFAIDSHSYGQAVFRPTAAGGTYVGSLPVPPADEAVYQHLESRMADAIRQVDGVAYSTGTTSNHAGTTDEYLFFDHHIFGFDLECGLEFQPPIGQAVTAALEVAAAVRALGACAAGQTGLDIPQLLQQRAAVADAMPQPPQPIAPTPEEPCHVEPLPQRRRPRLLVRVGLPVGEPPDEQAQILIDKGFDLILIRDQRYAEVIASQDDLEDLRQLGYVAVVERDLLQD